MGGAVPAEADTGFSARGELLQRLPSSSGSDDFDSAEETELQHQPQPQPQPEPEPHPWLRLRLEGPESWMEDQEKTIRALIEAESLRETPPNFHFFLGHRQVGGGSQIGELDEIFRSRLGLWCWRDLSQSVQDVAAMIRGVAQSSVYTLYLTKDALSYYVTIEARAAMILGKPVIVLMENDSRKPSYAGGSIESATEGWPVDLKAYLNTGRFVAWGGQPFEWSRADQDAKLKTVLEWCLATDAPVPASGVVWAAAVQAIESYLLVEGSLQRPVRTPAAAITEAAVREAAGATKDNSWRADHESGGIHDLLPCELEDGGRLRMTREDGSCDTWNVVRQLAECAYGTVNLAEQMTTRSGRTGKYAAVKQMSKARICALGSELYEDTAGEIEMLRLLREDPSPSIVNFMAVGQDATHLYLVLEFVSVNPRKRQHLELLDHVNSQLDRRLAEPEARLFFIELVDALDHLHRRGIYHLDVSLENILVRDAGMGRKGIKLIDFGLAMRNIADDADDGTRLFRTASGPIMPSRPAGKLGYAAPEVYRNEDFDGASADLWSAAVVLFAMLTGRFAYGRPNDDDPGFAALATPTREQLWYPRGNVAELLQLHKRSCSLAAEDLLSKMLIPSPDHIDARLSIKQVRQHAWVCNESAWETKSSGPVDELPSWDVEDSDDDDGLTRQSSGGLHADDGDGLTRQSSGGLRADDGDGLTRQSSGGLRADDGDGLTRQSSGTLR
eukprot:COSAG06_NODE_974_length_11258_cov_31.877319_9_plen_729_part_00